MQRSQQLRTATQTRRSARAGGFPEPDDFEGLPVRQWRQERVTVAPSSQQELTQQGNRWAVELPFGMPRESHLLPPHSQELLRAARSGQLYKRPAPTEEEEPDAEVDTTKGEKKDWEPPSDGFTVKMWRQVPRNAESQTVSHLAKRHKNTVTLASRAAIPQIAGPTVIRATVRRIDAAGNPYEQTVTLTEGQQVDGEIISTTIVPAPTAAQGELPVQQTTPVRRRPPPPKRKPKGPGRGRKKGKLPLPLPATRSQATAGEGASSTQPEAVGPDGVKIEDTEDSTNQDSEMVDMSGMHSEDEEGGEGEDEEGDEAGDDEGGETPNVEDASGEAQPADGSEMSEAIQPSSVEEPDEPLPAKEEVEEVTIPKTRVQPPSLANLGPQHAGMNLSRMEGSPLKNVMIQSPTEPSPMIPPQAANVSFSASNYLEVQSRTMSIDGSGSTFSQAYATQTSGHGILPPLRANRAPEQTSNHNAVPAHRPAQASPPAVAEKPTETPTTAADQPPKPMEPETQSTVPASTETESSQPPAEATTTTASTQPEIPGQSTPQVSLQPPDSPSLQPTAAAEDEDDGLNLLGSLERELDRQEGMSSASSGSDGKGTPAVAAGTAATTSGEAAPAEAAAASGDAADATAAPAETTTTAAEESGASGAAQASSAQEGGDGTSAAPAEPSS